MNMPRPRFVIVGGGAAGFFSAITCAESNSNAKITLIEKASTYLAKVKISGGGRCNVTHAAFDPLTLVQHYPRGGKHLLGPFYQFGPEQLVDWYQSRGVKLKTEGDGRMFPVSNKSQSIVDCLYNVAKDLGVDLHTKVRLDKLSPPKIEGQKWLLSCNGGEILYEADRVMLATGSNPMMWNILESMGLSIVKPVPSLFTFKISDSRINGLPGLSVEKVGLMVKTKRKKMMVSGPLLITHWGMSGPSILRLSAWGAFALAEVDYQFDLWVNWTGDMNRNDVLEALRAKSANKSSKLVSSKGQFGLPQRLWERLCLAVEICSKKRWAEVSKVQIINLSEQLVASKFEVIGQNRFKAEFVTAGGVALNQVDFGNMESKKYPGLHFGGEVLNIDAITGGFNFQAAWTTGYIAGLAMV